MGNQNKTTLDATVPCAIDEQASTDNVHSTSEFHPLCPTIPSPPSTFNTTFRRNSLYVSDTDIIEGMSSLIKKGMKPQDAARLLVYFNWNTTRAVKFLDSMGTKTAWPKNWYTFLQQLRSLGK